MKPATPLPWKVTAASPGRYPSYSIGNESAFVAQVSIMARGGSDKDARYLAHAANAYPQLVAALQGALGYVDYVANNGNDDADRHAANVRALLRDLGEDA